MDSTSILTFMCMYRHSNNKEKGERVWVDLGGGRRKSGVVGEYDQSMLYDILKEMLY